MLYSKRKLAVLILISNFEISKSIFFILDLICTSITHNVHAIANRTKPIATSIDNKLAVIDHAFLHTNILEHSVLCINANTLKKSTINWVYYR